MPRLGGIEAARRLKETGSKAKLVFLTVHQDPALAYSALATGATGYVVKGSAAEELLDAIHAVLEGRTYVSSTLAPAERS
jgi:DNA-binding NarL/FixJ family response regulator